MANILDYIKWRGDLSFHQDSFNEVDGLILSTLAYVEFEQAGINLKTPVPKSLKEVGELFAKYCSDEKVSTGRLIPNKIIELLDEMSRCIRYQDMLLSHYVNQVDVDSEKQFSAIVIEPGDGTIFIAFRGTDDTLIGWKEDFNMCFKSPVPSQLQAVEYIDLIASNMQGDIRLGGHSKGGNLSVFASAFCRHGIEERIISVYNYDGPGFTKDVLSQMNRNESMKKVHTIIPESSVIGLLMEHEEEYDVVLSSSNGIFQHDPFSWEVMGTEFIEVDDISARAYKLDHTLSDFLVAMNAEQKRELIDSLFGVLMNTGAKTLSDISFKEMPAIIKNFHEEENENKQLVLQAIKLLMQSAYGQHFVQKKANKEDLLQAKTDHKLLLN